MIFTELVRLNLAALIEVYLYFQITWYYNDEVKNNCHISFN